MRIRGSERAKSIMRQLSGLVNARLISGQDLEDLEDAQLMLAADEATIFGRVTPRQKERLVGALADLEAHVALAFGEEVQEDRNPGRPGANDGPSRQSDVAGAFNSPFWPFVLATTAVGQEGLDFHLYCRDIVHWNLPSNPVDLEHSFAEASSAVASLSRRTADETIEPARRGAFELLRRDGKRRRRQLLLERSRCHETGGEGCCRAARHCCIPLDRDLLPHSLPGRHAGLVGAAHFGPRQENSEFAQPIPAGSKALER